MADEAVCFDCEEMMRPIQRSGVWVAECVNRHVTVPPAQFSNSAADVERWLQEGYPERRAGIIEWHVNNARERHV